MTTPAVPDDEEFTELRDARIHRMDGVGKGANGTAWLIAKQANGSRGLLDPSLVRDLIGPTAPEQPETVTVSGSPAAIAKLIHEAAVAKAKYDADDLKRMAANGQAMTDESYPVADLDDLRRAVRAVGRGGSDHDAIRRHIISRAKALGASSEIPDNWNSDGSLKEGSVSKMTTMAMELDDGLDPTMPLAEPDTDDAPGDPLDPGSPAWEAIDAATAQKWTSIAVRLKNALCVLADRELLEAATVDPDDADHAFDLQDAMCAADYVIETLAGFAVGEQAEADLATEAMESIGKALAGFDTAPLETIEGFAAVGKAGRVLSSANEAAIRGAVDSLQKVLASLPQAPETTDSGLPVAKEEQTVTATTAEPDAVQEMGTPKDDATPAARPVEKADSEGKTAQVAVYDKKGNLVGIVDPGDITPIAGAEADDEADEPDDADTALADDADGAAPQDSDLDPAPAAEVGTPADAVPDGVTKQQYPSDDVLKGIAADLVRSELDAYSAAQQEVIAKQAADHAQLADEVEKLRELVKALEEQPAIPKVFTNGAVPPPQMMRGQNAGAPPIEVAKTEAMKRALYGGSDASEQNKVFADMQALAIAELQQVHQRPQ